MRALKKAGKAVIRSLLSVVVASAAVLPALPAGPVQAASDVVPRTFSAPEELGTLVTTPAVLDSAYGVEDGKQVMYTTVTGNPNVAANPAYFNVVDLENYSLVRSLPLQGGGQSWGHVVDAQGQVYIVSANSLYRYSPVTKTVAKLGTPDKASTAYGLAVDEQGVVYGGGYPTGAVFKYDPATNQITDYGRLSEGKEYVRAIAYYGGFVYAGTGVVGELYKLNPADGSKTLIPFPANAGFTAGNEPTVYAMNAVRNLLFIHMSSTPNKLLIYDMDASQWLPQVVDNYRGMYVAPERDGKTYYVADGKYHEFDLNTRTSTPTDASFSSYFRKGAWVEVQDDPELPGTSLATILFNGAVALANFETGVVKSWMPVVPGTPVSIQSLEFGPDGLLYSTGYQGAYGARYNITNGNIETFSMGQAEGMIAYGNKMIFGEYPSAHMHELDTTKPLERDVNPHKIHEIGYSQDRPFAMTTGEGKLFVGTIPKLGELKGALSIYDGTTWQTFENVVDNQSIMGLAYRDGKLYGSTTVWGGLGIDPTATEAKMFVWDVAAGRKLEEFVPAIQQAGSTKAKAIGGLSFGPDGLLWGAAYGTIFAMNPDTHEIVKQKEITATDWNFDHSWVPVKLRWDAEGILYTTLGSQVVAVDPSTMAFFKVPGTKTNLMTLGPDGNLYYNEASVLKKITVSKERPPIYIEVEVPVVNSGFEQVNGDGTIPGWTSISHGTGGGEFAVVQEPVKAGANSLKVADPTAESEVGVISDPFPVTPGLEYSGKANIYLESGRTIFAMRYYDEAGKEIKLTPAPANYFSSPSQRWASADFSSIAPAGAVTGKLVLFCSLSWIGTAYFDDVKVYKRVATEVPPEGPVVQELDVVNAGFEQLVQAGGAIPGWVIRKPETLVGKDAAIELSSEKVNGGSQSLRLYDNETALEVAVDSELIPVIGGRTYTTAMDVYRTSNPPGRSSNRPILQVRYHDATGKEMAVVQGVTMSKEVTTAANQWGSVSLETPAPANAKFIRLILIGAANYVASVYADNISVTTNVAPEDRTVLVLHREPMATVSELTDVTFEAAATVGSTIVVKEGELTVAEAIGLGEETPVTVTIPAPAIGTHPYKVYANVEGLGKSAAIALPAVTVKEDTTPPSIVVSGAADGGDYTDSVTPVVAITDSGSGVQQSSVKLNGADWTSGTAIAATGAYTLSITADDKKGNLVEKTVSFSVYGSTTLAVADASGAYGDTVELQATLTDRSGEPIVGGTVAFRVNDQTAGEVQTDAEGKAALSYKVAVTNGQNSITAVYAQNDAAFLRGASATAELLVADVVTPDSVELDRASASLAVNESVKLNAKVLPYDVADQTVVWSVYSSTPEGAVSVTADGLVQAHHVGQAIVRATSAANAVYAESVIAVDRMPSGVTLELAGQSRLYVGESDQTVTETVYGSSRIRLTSGVGYASSNQQVAAVDQTGRVRALAAGSTVISAVYGNLTASYELTVQPAPEPYVSVTSNTPNQPAEPENGQLELTAKQWAELMTPEGTVELQFGGEFRELVLPVDAAGQDGLREVSVASDSVTVVVPGQVLKALAALIPADQLDGSKLKLEAGLVGEAAGRELLQSAGEAASADITAAGEIIEFKLSVTAKDGRVYTLEQFEQPIQIKLRAAKGANRELAGIYYVSDDGRLEYVGGTWQGDVLTADVGHFSKYAVLEYRKTYADLAAAHWAADVVQKLSAKHLIEGTSVSSFEPERDITRAEFAAMLVRMLGLSSGQAASFRDVDAEAWYADEVAAAAEAGIVQGVEDGRFAPDASIKRQEMAAMLLRAYKAAAGAAGQDGSTAAAEAFGDMAGAPRWAADAVRQAHGLDLVSGREAGQFQPEAHLTRAESAQAIYNLMTKLD